MFPLANVGTVVPVKVNGQTTPQNGVMELGSRLLHLFGRRLMSISSDYVTVNVEEDRKWTSKLNGRILLTYTYLAVSTFRFALISFCLSFPDSLLTASYLLYDPMSDLLHRTGILDRNLALLIIPSLPLVAYIDYQVSFTRRYRIYLHNFDLLVLNREDFYALNPQVDSWGGGRCSRCCSVGEDPTALKGIISKRTPFD